MTLRASLQQRLVAPPACRCSRRHPAAAAATATAAPVLRRRTQRLVRASASAAWEEDSRPARPASRAQPSSLAEAKAALLYAVAGTDRGGDARALQRGMVEEAQVVVESMGSSEELDYEKLQGRWKLEYTTARDVLPLVAPQRLPAPLRVGRIWQEFSSLDQGVVQNVIEALPPAGLPLADGASLTLIVEAGWEPRTARSIALTFREAGFQEVRLSPGLQNLLASPILPRGWWNQQLLLALKQLSVRVPLVSRLPGTASNQQRPRGINYMLTFLDEDMLIGRAQGNGGSFIFTRDTEWEAEHGSAGQQAEQQQQQQQQPRVQAAPGTRVAVLERAELRPRGAQFLIQPSGVRALEAIFPELKQAVARHHLDHQCTRRFSHTGEVLYSSDNGSLTAAISDRGELISLPWHVLQRELADALPPGVLRTSHRFLRFAETADGVEAEFQTADGGSLRVEAGLLIGCDGSQSPVRQQLFDDGPPTFLRTAIWRAVRPLPANWPVEHGWCAWSSPPGAGKAVVMTATLRDGQVAWQAFQPWPVERLAEIGGGRREYVQDTGAPAAAEQQAAAGKSSGSSDWRAAGAERLQRALASVEGYPDVVVDLIAGTDPSAIVEHGQFCREPELCQEYARGRVALVGDAAHLATPILGMGCSLALEDACELGRAIGEHGVTPDALQAYQAVRVPAAGEVQAASVQLYKDLRAGQLKQPFDEFRFCIEHGFADRTFAPLAPTAAAVAAEPAAAVAAPAAAPAVEVQAS
ncbi:putative plastid-lipid-associated chloroplastic isoform X2 [Chlorella sorokiniana]|uniref:Plastid-lipid-associated chloroplastic isoform X2 n=1 Tax=Chlorella sorokiniana TaxID=3076 RepID=A0A2P6TGG9_CHLSO|nr:putative plastid-lipid-associated chloroplastic isoform X2 [Chlorella sorokiniana]|eukprot:PRW33218.1 putative plastid-lipid-associated chloroplastic isoform X2 [Chlorella sorokiniana]